MARSLIETQAHCEKLANEALNEVRKKLGEGQLGAYQEARKNLDNAVSDLNIATRKVAYETFMRAEYPLIEAIKTFTVKVYKVKEETDKETELITGVSLEEKTARVNLADFCAFGDLDTKWLTHTAQLLQLLQMRETDVFKMTPSELSKKSYFFISAARKKMEGETPDSNTQIVKLLQTIFDLTICTEGGTSYKCTNHDIAFIQECAFQFDAKAKCGLKSMNERQFQAVMMSVLYRCLTGSAYTVKNAKIKTQE